PTTLFRPSPLLEPPTDLERPRCYVASKPIQPPRAALGDRLAEDGFRAVWDGDEVELSYEITNKDRTFGAALGGQIALEWGNRMPSGVARVSLRGEAGQSFGAVLTNGLERCL